MSGPTFNVTPTTPNISTVTPQTPTVTTGTPNAGLDAAAPKTPDGGDGVSPNSGGADSGRPSSMTVQVDGGATVTLVHLGIEDAANGGRPAIGGPPDGTRLVQMPRETGLGPLGRFALSDLDPSRRGQMHSIFEALARHDGRTGDDLVQALADTEGNAGALQRLEQQAPGSLPQQVVGTLKSWFTRTESGGPSGFTRAVHTANMLVGIITDGGLAAIGTAGIEHGYSGNPASVESPYNPPTGSAGTPDAPVLPGPISIPDPADPANHFEQNTNRQPAPPPRRGTYPDGTGPDGNSGNG